MILFELESFGDQRNTVLNVGFDHPTARAGKFDAAFEK